MQLSDKENSKIKMRAMIPGWKEGPKDLTWYSPQAKNKEPNGPIMDNMAAAFKRNSPLASRVNKYYFYCNFTNVLLGTRI